MSLLSKALVWALLLLLLVAGSEAHDTLHYAQSPPEWQKWFGEARTTEESRPRLSAQGFIWHSCCNKADRVKTQLMENGTRIFIYEHGKSGDLFSIPDPKLELNHLEMVQKDVAHLLEHGLGGAVAGEGSGGVTTAAVTSPLPWVSHGKPRKAARRRIRPSRAA